MSGLMEAALVTVRLMQFAAAFFLLGAPAFGLALALCCAEDAPARRDVAAWLGRCMPGAAAAALVSSVLWLDLEAAIMGDGWSQALDPATIETVLFGTLFGRVWVWHLGLGLALLAAALALRWRPRSPMLTGLVAALGATHVATLAWAGHAVMHPGGIHVLVQAVHLLAGALWLGSLPALHRFVRRARNGNWIGWEEPLRVMLPRYSDAGSVAVGLILLTGILNSLFLLGGASSLVTTAFGRVLLAKICLVLLLVGVAADNRFVLLPRIAGAEPAVPLDRLSRSVAVEQGLGLLILMAVSVLGTLPPG